MAKAATKEFIIGLVSIEGAQKFTPRAATVNGIKGRIWTKRTLENGAWIHQGKQHVRSAAEEAEVTAAFDCEITHHDADAFWGEA